MTPDRRIQVAVCMATYEPEPARLRAQLQSLRAQELTDWHCWVADDASSPSAREALRAELHGDERFTLVEHAVNVGFYRNFERCLALVPPEVQWVALSDQDDLWAPNKLVVLLAAAGQDRDVTMVYSDVEIRDAEGALLSPTYWVGRQHNETDLAALLFANTVSGAAALVRRDVIDAALPFPPRRPSSFHDHWLAVVARCCGVVAYVDAPLQAYVQHPANVIGHRPATSPSSVRVLARLLRRRWWRRPRDRYYDDEVRRLSQLAATALARLAPEAEDAAVLRAVASLHSERPALGWLVRQAVHEARDPSVTMHRRRRVLASVLWTQWEGYRGVLGRSRA